MFIKLVEKAKNYASPYSNVCIDTCHEMRVSGPLSDKYLVSLLGKISQLSHKQVVIGIEGMNFSLKKNDQAGQIELYMTGDSQGIKLCRVVF